MERRRKRSQAGAAERQDLSSIKICDFQNVIYDHYRVHGRKMAWRETTDPYCILVSEIMLQQTQVARVVEKYREFITAFPDISALDRASFQEVLSVWQGLGYNRRALALKAIARQVMEDFSGALPRSFTDLMRLKGVGRSTAGAVTAFAFNDPAVFIETNIRTVFIHFFFADDDEVVEDFRILPLIEATLDHENPRVWYWALMDYGAMLKKNGIDLNLKSAHYQRQTSFHGSSRQIRGRILKALVSAPGLTQTEMACETGFPLHRIVEGVERLEAEGFIVSEAGRYRISE
jgi:A/G-specific adenine glycosylase